MNDLSTTIAPKSDQLNADDFIGREGITIRISEVRVRGGDQPVVIHFDGDNGKPWLPCKSMRRVLVQVWGKDGDRYKGRSLTLFRDPSVRFGGSEVGGIRISHMSDISEPKTMSLTTTKATRKPYTVQPLAAGTPLPPKQQASPDAKRVKAQKRCDAIVDEINKSDDVMAALAKHSDEIARLRSFDATMAAAIDDAAKKRNDALAALDDDDAQEPEQVPLIKDDGLGRDR